jgi:hypothetical protein
MSDVPGEDEVTAAPLPPAGPEAAPEYVRY